MAVAEGRDPALEELRRRYQEGDLVLFAGAGVSAAAGELQKAQGCRPRAFAFSASAVDAAAPGAVQIAAGER